MGTPIPEPIPPDPVPAGGDCPACWGPGKEFGDEGTPSSIVINFSGISKGPNWQPADGNPPEGDITLPQNMVEGPCLYSILDTLEIDVNFGPITTVVLGSKVGGFGFFQAPTTGPCVTVLSNSLNDHFSGGTATITIPDVI